MVLLKSLTALQDTLGGIVVVPKVRGCSPCLELGDLTYGTGCVKDNSAGQPPVS